MNHDFLIGSAQLNQAFESQEFRGSGGHGNGITRRSFIKRTGSATVATMIAWNATAESLRACSCCNSGCSCPSYYSVRYMFIVEATPEETNPDQVEGSWKNKKYPTTGTPSDEHFDNEIRAGAWEAGSNEYYAVYKFAANAGPSKGETNTIKIGGSAWGELYEDDPGDRTDGWGPETDEDDLEAGAQCTMSSRTWKMNPETGEITTPVEVLEIQNSASPGSGYAKCMVNLTEFVGVVLFDYSFVSGYNFAGEGSTEGGGGGWGVSYSQGSTRETSFRFVWRIKKRKKTTYYRCGEKIGETNEDTAL